MACGNVCWQRPWIYISFSGFVTAMGLFFTLILHKSPVSVCPALTHAGAAYACDYNWIGHRGRCYLFVDREVNYSTAKEECKTHHADLLNVNNEQDTLKFLNSFLLKSTWLGFACSNNDYRQNIGSVFSWNVQKYGNCGRLERSNGTYICDYCSLSFSFACHKKAKKCEAGPVP